MQSSRVRWKLSWVDTLGKVSVTEAGHLQKCKNTVSMGVEKNGDLWRWTYVSLSACKSAR